MENPNRDRERKKAESGRHHVAAKRVSCKCQNITSNPRQRGDKQIIKTGLIYKRELTSNKPEPLAKQLYLMWACEWLFHKQLWRPGQRKTFNCTNVVKRVFKEEWQNCFNWCWCCPFYESITLNEMVHLISTFLWMELFRHIQANEVMRFRIFLLQLYHLFQCKNFPALQ